MGIWLGPYKMHKITKNTRFGNVKLGFYCTFYDLLENKNGYFGAE
jgi:hypothetical protein